MKALVTGVSGLIGARIAVACLKRGWEVKGVDIVDCDNPDVDFVKASIMDSKALRKAISGCDYVFHQAAASSSPMFYPDPTEGVAVNTIGSINVFRNAEIENVSKVVAASTSSIYGSLPLPSREDQLIEAAPNMYAASKLAMENLGNAFSAVTGLGIIFLRYFSVYGIGERRKGKIANMLSQFLWDALELDGKGRRPVIYGDGEQTRDLIFADDVAKANILAARSKAASGVYNIGTGRETSLNRMISMISEATGKKIEPEYVKNPIRNYIFRTLADTSKARRDFNFTAETTVEAGLRKLIRELRE
jgi:nucleoside-diphosphate-sugar epimerase